MNIRAKMSAPESVAPALTTPATIAFVRQHAIKRSADEIARALGWDMPRLHRLAQQHHIELCGARPAESVVEPQPAPHLEPSPAASIQRARRPHFPVDREQLAAMSIDDIIQRLPRQQALVLAILRRTIDGAFLDANLIAQRIGVSHRDGVRSPIISLCSKLAKGARYRIQSSKGPGGGYRLVTVRDGP